MKYLLTLLFLASSLLVMSCSPMTLNKVQKHGADTLDARDIFNLVSGNTLSLTAYDFDGTVYFDEQGRLAAVDNEGQKDSGRWDIKNNNQLCIKFSLWYYGDVKCYSIVNNNESDNILFYTTNGAAYYTGLVHGGDSSNLSSTIPQKKSSTYLRKSLSAEQTGESPDPKSHQESDRPLSTQPTTIETSSGVRRLAQNCKGCDLSGVDLKEAMLVKAELENANLSNADLRYANLRRARLAGANLSGAQLNHANLPGADLRGCNLQGADLSGANLLLTDLTGADLSGANLTNAHLEKTIGLEK